MSGRHSVLLCHCPEDAGRAEQLRDAILAGAKDCSVSLWSGAANRAGGKSAPGRIADAIENAGFVAVLVRQAFLNSRASAKIRRPLRAAAQRGVETGIVLTGHCIYELTWLKDLPVIFGGDQTLDSVNTHQRDAVFAEIASSITRQLGITAESESSGAGRQGATPRAGAADEETPTPRKRSDTYSPYARRLGAFIHGQKEIAGQLQHFARLLLLVALASAAASVLVGAADRNRVLFFTVAGFGVFAAALALVLAARRDWIEQRIILAQYVRTGFIDETIPSRQRSALTRKADALLGNFSPTA
jgi:hypothetical protein